MAFSFESRALAPSYYATNSMLSSGNWAKIEVTSTGMQYLSDATIKNLGFSDPTKVNVYGYGGVVVPENLDSPDDLPLVPSIRVNSGIVFFGKNSVGWEKNSGNTKAYNHLWHPYSDHAYYFISDVNPQRPGAEKAAAESASSGEVISEFTERLVHEQDAVAPMNTGRLILGEDFRSTTSRSFKFDLPGSLGEARVTVAFGCKTSSGTSSITLTANGKQLPATTSDRMAYSSSKEIVLANTTKEISNVGTSLDLGIKFNGTGNVTKANLDYIEVEYQRALKINGSELYFYLAPQAASHVVVEGATSSTVLWDVTKGHAPQEVAATLKGNTLEFVTPGAYREYVAFDPSKVTRAVSPSVKVANQDIHAMPAPRMLIISPAEYVSAAERIVTLHQKTDGLSVAVLTPEVIYNEFSSGKADVSAFRKLLKMWYDKAEGREGEYADHCLIMSRPTYDNKLVTPAVRNAGYPRVPIWQTATGETETASYSTDDYIGMLGDVKTTFNIGTSEIHVAVGRMPVKSLNEANTAIDKLEDYLLKPDLGAWRNNIMVIADDQDNGVHLDQAEAVVTEFKNKANGTGSNFLLEKLYLDSYKLEYTGTGASYPAVRERLLKKWNEGTALIDYIGHANPKSWGHEGLLTWTDIVSMSNTRLPILYAATCEFMRWDADEVSGGEIMWLYPNSGVIGMICPSREVLISSNGVLNKSTARYMFAQDDNNKPLTIGEVMRKGKNVSNTGSNKLRYGLLGDPMMRMPWPDLKMKVDKINGINLAEAEEFPIVKARQNVTLSGHVEATDGSVLKDFNGTAEITIYDAEKVITTNGNGSDGKKSDYNDRKNRLFVGRTKVKEGQWSISFTMPAEIENNYSPALINMYASDDKMREANGASEEFYAYGYDTTAPEDFKGPKMIEFYLNTPNFTNGQVVGPNPVLVARFSDESGISVSEAGIGHSITLDLDGKTYYDDVAHYYEPDLDKGGAGKVTYPLGDIEKGQHRLTFTVWDTANNSTTATLDFSISALWKPTIETLTTDVNPATSSVNFIVGTDGATDAMEVTIDVYDLWGRRVWRDKSSSLSGHNTRTVMKWDLNDFAGGRVQGGVYLYRATVKTDTGATVAKTNKLVVKSL